MSGCYDATYRCLRRPGDTVETEGYRRVLLPAWVFAMCISAAAILNNYRHPGVYLGGLSLTFVTAASGSLYILLRIPGSYTTMMSWLALPLTMGILAIDLANASTGAARLWPTVVLVMDVLFVVNSTRVVQVVIVAATMIYFAVLSAEEVILVGVYDIALSGHGYWLCSCSDPPCATPVVSSVFNWMIMSCVFVLDFMITRSFATRLRRQTRVNGATVTVAELVAQLLADYAIDEARCVVSADGEQLSEPLRDAFGRLLDNLERYRAFLPPGLLAGNEIRSTSNLAVEESNQVVPQLAVQPMRRAAEHVWSQAARHCRQKAENAITGVLQACIAVGDVLGAQRLLRLGWDAPAELVAQVHQVVAPHLPDSMFAAFLIPGSPVEPLSGRRFSIQTRTTTTLDGQGVSGRFGDGADHPAGSLVAVPLWHAEYIPPPSLDAVHGMADWHEVTGVCHWPGEAVEQLIGDYHTLYGRYDAKHNMIALFAYTAEFHHSVVWATWQGDRWRGCANQDACVEPGARHLRIDEDSRQQLDLGPGTRTMELLTESPHGARVYAVDGEPRLLRYENTCRGDPEASPLNDTVLWTAAPEHLTAPGLMFSAVRNTTPVPPGILEFVTSRDFSGSYSGRDWGSAPLNLFSGLRDECMAQKNQQRPKDSICRLALKAFSSAPSELGGHGVEAEQLAAALPLLHRAKCPSSTPSPAEIAHACELGMLRWQGSPALVALTGEPRVAVPLTDSAPGAVQLWRVDSAYWPAQPYLLMNSAMRSQQLRDRDARLVSSKHPLPFYARQPSEPPAAPEAVVFRNAAGTARWVGSRWVLSMAEDVADSNADITPQAWGLPQFRAVIWHIDNILRELCRSQGPVARVKGYRGLQGVTLDRSVYARGMIVMFSAFTSTTGDQGVAVSFAQGEGAAVVFTTYTKTGCLISQWSRFGREKEVLLRPNTLHLVTDALSAEHAAIVDKEALQVFDLKEVSPAEAACHLAKEGAVAISGEHPGVLQQASRIASSAERGDWDSALRELLATPVNAAVGGGEGRFVRAVVPKASIGIIVLVLSSAEGHEIGAALDPWLWNGFFEQAEAKARGCHAHLITTNLGHIIVTLAHPDGPEASAQAAVGLALELIKCATDPIAQRRRSPGSPLSLFHRSPRPNSPELALQVHCGVSVGTVHSGFGGSARRRVEIADGPAVRRAFRMAAYSHRHGVREVVTDSGGAAAAASAGSRYTTWTLDLVSFDSRRDLREPITCVEEHGEPGGTDATTAFSIREAWDAVEAAAKGSGRAAARARECILSLPPAAAAYRAAHALREAAAQPSTYCYDLESGL